MHNYAKSAEKICKIVQNAFFRYPRSPLAELFRYSWAWQQTQNTGSEQRNVAMWRVEQLMQKPGIRGCCRILALMIDSSTLLVKWAWKHSIFGNRTNFGEVDKSRFSVFISKDSTKADRRGRPCSDHFWEEKDHFWESSAFSAVVQWELTQNSIFAVPNSDGERAITRHYCEMPIGGHLKRRFLTPRKC